MSKDWDEEKYNRHLNGFFMELPNFKPEEFQCPDGSRIPFWEPEFKHFMIKLQVVRTAVNFPFVITSGYRSPEYNDQLYVDMGYEPGGHLTGPHTRGAADILVSFERMYKLVTVALAQGMGVGIKQHGDVDKRFVHLDDLGPRLWTYT